MTGDAIDRRARSTAGRSARLRWWKRVPGVVELGHVLRSLSTPLGRGRLRAMWRGARLFQRATVTEVDRHPALFDLVAAQLADHDAPRILSFGCATGEEAFALARRLPRATIDAIDANPACIARALRSMADRGLPRMRFLCADSPDAVAPADYDAVLCLSVLRHGDLEALNFESSARLFPFARFAAAVAALDRRVRPGGLLLLWGCHFRFTDTAIAARYRIVPVAGMRPQPGPFYGRDDRRLPDPSCTAFVFAKTLA